MGMAYCSNCGTEISDRAVSCPKCGHPGPGAAPVWTPPVVAHVAGPAGTVLAGWWQRAVAAIIDSIILAVPTYILMAVLSLGTFAATTRFDPETGELTEFDPAGFFAGFFISLLVGAVITVAYRVILEGSPRGQTVGKMAMKIRVADVNTGGPIGYGRAFVRWLVATVLWLVLYIPGLIDILFPLWDPKRQTIHDKAANSVVVVTQ